MTQGYQDWQRTAQQTGPLLVNQANTRGLTPKTYGPANVAVWAALTFVLTPENAGVTFTLTFSWFADAAMTQPMGTATWTASQGAVIADQVVNLGPFVTITVACTSAAPDNGFAFRVVPITTVAYGAKQIPNGAIVLQPNVALAAGATNTVFATLCTSGPATLWISGTTGGIGHARLSYLDGPLVNIFAATVTSIAGAGWGTQVAIDLVGSTIQLATTNDSGGPNSFQAGVVPRR